MKAIFPPYALALLLTITIFGCNKKGPEPQPAVCVICDGNGDISRFPLAEANQWKYLYKQSGVLMGFNPELNVVSDTLVNGRSYMALSDASGILFSEMRFYRRDISNNNIYYYNPDHNLEFLEVPGNPVLNSSWTYMYWKRKVTNLSANIKTESCSYDDLLEVSEFEGAAIRKTLYFKKGVGLVYQTAPDLQIPTVSVEFILSDVSLR